MQVLKIRSNAKLNLTFEILGDLLGGYHNVRTVFQSIDLADELMFALSPIESSEEFQVDLRSSSDLHDMPLDESNLIVKAARMFHAKTGCGAGFKLDVYIDKRIPIAAGMAGGSSNAAATLFAMQYFFKPHCTQSQTDEIAASLGSDINFCLRGGTQLGTNRGELLHPVKNDRELFFLIVKPCDIAISTPWIYRQYDEFVRAQSLVTPADSLPATSQNFSQSCIDVLATGALTALPKTFFNSFEEICLAQFPEVRKLKDSMLAVGCLSAKITGSGPTLFGLVSDYHAAESARKALLQKPGGVNFDCWCVQSSKQGLFVSAGSA